MVRLFNKQAHPTVALQSDRQTVERVYSFAVSSIISDQLDSNIETKYQIAMVSFKKMK